MCNNRWYVQNSKVRGEKVNKYHLCLSYVYPKNRLYYFNFPNFIMRGEESLQGVNIQKLLNLKYITTADYDGVYMKIKQVKIFYIESLCRLGEKEKGIEMFWKKRCSYKQLF